MGTLRKFNLNYFIDNYKLSTFVETGTFKGDAIDYALNFNFSKIFSIEINEKFYNEAKERYLNETKVSLFLGDTSKDFPILLSNINENENCLFWLDAHLPSHYGINTEELETVIPLEKELNYIKNHPSFSNNVYLIDDLRIYENGQFSSGNWDYIRKNYILNGIDFIEKLFKDTHIINKTYDDEGYLIIVPKK